jgi:hypothetical protein
MRNPKLEGLPACVAYRVKNGYDEVHINNHPNCKIFSSKKFGIAKLEAIKFITELEVTDTIHEKEKGGGDELKAYIGLAKTQKGYHVNKVHKGKIYDKCFERKDRTDEENKQAAIVWFNELIKKLL